jgi:hypothetical protein
MVVVVHYVVRIVVFILIITSKMDVIHREFLGTFRHRVGDKSCRVVV